jgi:iron complex transport system substrate-binding protein
LIIKIKHLKHFHFIYAAIVATLWGCNNTAATSEAERPVSFYPITYAKLFGIAKFKNHEQLFYLNGNDTIWSVKSTELPDKNARMAVLSSVFAGFIEELQLQESIIAVDNEKYFNNENLLERVRKGDVVSIGEEGQIQTEKLIGLHPDILITSSFGFNDQSLKSRLNKFNILVLMCDNFKEQHPLARAEWIRFFGFLYHRTPSADSIFSAIEKNYLRIADSASRRVKRPRVMTDAMYGDVWNIPGGNSYSAKLIEDAGGDYLFKNKTELYTYPLNLESVLKAASDADIWLHINQFKTRAELVRTDKRYSLFRPFAENRIYNNNKRENAFGGNDFWEKGAVRADWILSDLANIFSGDKILPDKLYFYKHVD